MSEPEVGSQHLMVEVARRFYLRDQSKVEIANDLGISRFRVARLLAEARDNGIVTIRVSPLSGQFADLEQQLIQHLALDDAVVVESKTQVEQEREELARGAAQYMRSVISPGQVIGLSWGRTLLPVAAYLEDLPAVTFVQLTGVVGNDASKSPIEIISRIRRHSKVEAKSLIAPLFAASIESAEALKKEPGVSEAFALYRELDVAVLSVGSWVPRLTQLEELFDDDVLNDLDQAGAIADFGGLFFDKDGKYVESSVNDRRLSVSAEMLARTPVVMAVAGETPKAPAIHAVCMTGLVTCLVTSRDVAQELLKMPAVTSPIWPRVH